MEGSQSYGKHFPKTLKAFYETKEGLKTKLLSHGLLQYLDIFKPFLVIPLEKLEVVETTLMRHIPLNMNLEFWNIPVQSYQKYFPESFVGEDLLKPLIDKLAFTIAGTSRIHVCILDILTCLCLLLFGPWRRKMEIMFKWYNLNKTGLMEEEEHFVFLKRIGHCLRKLKFIGAMELTDDDAKFMAVEARIVFTPVHNNDARMTSSNIVACKEGKTAVDLVKSFRPGLYIDDFVKWSESNTVCKLVFEFIRVFQRLVDVLAMLETRSERLLQISAAKQTERTMSYPIPIDLPNIIKKDSINNFTAKQSITMVYADGNQLSFCIQNDRALDHQIGYVENVYARIDREVEHSDTFQQSISTNIISRNKARNDAMYVPGLRLPKFLTVSSVRLVSVAPIPTKSKPNPPITIAKRIDVKSLEPGVQYRITVFNDKGDCFRTIRVKTPVSGSQSLSSNDNSFAIFPSSVDKRHLIDVRNTGILKDNCSILYTGTVGNYSQLLDTLITTLSKFSLQEGLEAFTKFVASSLIMLKNEMRYQFLKDTFHLTDLVYTRNIHSQRFNAFPSIQTEPIQNISGKQRLLFFNGCGPLTNSEMHWFQLKKLLGVEYFKVFTKIWEDSYAEECIALSSPNQKYAISRTSSLWYLDSKDSISTQQGSSFDVEALTTQLIDQMYNSHILTASSTSLTCHQEVLVLMKSPIHLFDDNPDETWNNALYKYLSTGVTHPHPVRRKEPVNGAPIANTSKIPGSTGESVEELEKVEEAIKLRGKHELIHGEYSSKPNIQQRHVGTQGLWSLEKVHHLNHQVDDKSFCEFIMAAFSYSASIVSKTSSNIDGENMAHPIKPIVLVSTNWFGGRNFRLKRIIDGMEIVIEHINLLATTIKESQTDNLDENMKDDIITENERLLSRIKASLPKDVEFELASETSERILVVKGGLHEISFVEVANSVHSKSPSFAPLLSHHPYQNIKNTRPAILTNSPRCHQLSTSHTLIGVQADGVGVIKAFLYELPISLRYEQFRELMFTNEGRSKLLQVFPPETNLTDDSNIRYLRGKPRYCLFRFENLRPHTCYGVYFETPHNKKELEKEGISMYPLDTFMFKTHATIEQSNVSTFLFTSFVTEEGGYSSAPQPGGLGSYRMKKLGELHDVYRFSNSHVAGIFCQHDEAAIRSSFSLSHSSFTTLQRFNLLELGPPPVKDIYLNDVKDYFSDTKMDFEPSSTYFKFPDAQKTVELFPQFGKVHISFHGIYGYIMPTLPTNESLREIVKSLKLPIWKDKNIKVLIIFTGKTLVHSLFRDKKGNFTSERATYENKVLVAEFIDALLKWKFEDSESKTEGMFNSSTSTGGTVRRDIKLIGAGHIPKVATVIISRILQDPFIPLEQADTISLAQSQMASSHLSRLSSAEDLLSMDSTLSKSLAEKSKKFPLNPLQLSHMSSIFSKTGIHFTIFPVYFDPSPIKAKFEENANAKPVGEEEENSLGESQKSNEYEKKNLVDNTSKEMLLLPEGVNYLDADIIYEVLPESVAKFNGMSYTKARTELYAEAVTKFSEQEPVFYRIDLLMDDIFAVPLPDPEVDYEASIASNSEFVLSTSQNGGGSMHGVWMNVQEIVSRVDFLRVVVGPMIGKVTMTDVRVVFEFNMDIPELTCVLRRSTGIDPEQRSLEYLALESGLTVEEEAEEAEMNDGSKIPCRLFHITAYKPVLFHFSGLQADSKYEILIPRLFPYKILGTFRTTPKYIANTDIIFSGGNHFMNVPIIRDVLNELSTSQSINLQNIRVLNDFVYNLPSEELLEYDRMPSMWNLLRDRLNSSGATASVVLHLAPQTLISILWNKFLPIFLDMAKRIPLEVAEKNMITTMYLQQLEHSIKDTLTCILSSPAVAQVFSMCSNLILYHSDYLLPSNTTTGPDAEEDSPDYRYTILIRKFFQQHIRDYFVSMYGLDNPDAKDYFNTWRIGSVMMAMIDNVSGRSRLKKEEEVVLLRPISPKSLRPLANSTPEEGGGDDVEDDVEEIRKPAEEKGERNVLALTKIDSTAGSTKESLNPNHVFTLGFIDRSQWKSLRSLGLDNTITQLILIFENPLIPLYSIPETFVCPNGIGKGEALPWGPTINDLNIFFQYWIDWILKFRKQSKGLEIRSVLFVSQNEIPYTTVVQDIRTGLKIHQVCVGSYSLRDDHNVVGNSKRPRSSTIRKKELKLNGKIGTMRYTHRLTNQDYFRIEPFSKEAVRAMMSLSSENEINPSSVRNTEISNEMLDQVYYCGFAKLKIFLDNWNPVNLWANETLAEGDKPKVSLTRPKIDSSSDAILTLGPVIGVPYRISIEDQNATGLQEDSKKVAQDVDGENEEKDTTKTLVNVPVLLEVDRITSMTILVTGVVNGEKLEITAQNVKANIPIVINIGPLEKDERYLVQILTGVKPSPYNDFVISSHIHWDETNIIVLNAELTKEMNPSTILITDLTQRCSVPYNGINAVVHTNFQPNFEAMIQEHQYNQVLVDGLSSLRRRGRPSARLKQEVNEILAAFREKFRDLLSRPSYRELLKSPTSHIFLPQVTIPIYSSSDVSSDVLIEGEGRLQRATRLLQLIENRVLQEYVDQLRYPGCNVYRSITTSDIKQMHYPELDEVMIPQDGSMTKSQLEQLWVHYVRATCDLFQEPAPTPTVSATAGNAPPATEVNPLLAAPAIRRKIYWCLPGEDAVDSILSQWLLGCTPAPVVWLPFLSLNCKVSLEVLPVLTKPQLHLTSKLLAICTEFLATRKMKSWKSQVVDSTNSVPQLSSESQESVSQKSKYSGQKPQETLQNDEQPSVMTDKEYSTQKSFGCTRIIVVNGKFHANDSPEEFFNPTSEVTVAMVKHMHEWKAVMSHREYTIICPSNKYGTQVYQLQAKYYIPPPNPLLKGAKATEVILDFGFQVVDTIYRSNEFDRRYHMAERERHFQLTRKKIGAAAGKSKRAQQKREEEERIQRATMLKEIQDVMAKQIPDGYLIIRAFTTTILSTPDPPPPPAGIKTVLDEKKDVDELSSRDIKEIDDADKERGKEGNDESEEPKNDKGESKENTDEFLPAERPGSASAEKALAVEDEKLSPDELEGEKIAAEVPVYDPYAHIDIISSLAVTIQGDKVASEVQATGSIAAFENGVSSEMEALKNYEKFVTLQLPLWMVKLLLPSETVFVQDEILLVMRQSTKTKRILDRIESGEFATIFIKFYENSRLSELSRPPDLREVDLTIDGIIPIFFRDVVNRIWEYGLPEDVKARMLNLTDPFVRSFCFSRAMPNMEILSSATSFAQAVNHACIMSIAMKTARRMSKNPKYTYLMEVPDPAALAVAGIEKEEEELEQKKIELEIEKAEILGVQKLLEQIRNIGIKKSKYQTKKQSLDPEVEKELEEKDKQIKNIEEEAAHLNSEAVNYDSDIEELDKEIELAERLQEEKDEMDDLEAMEKDDIEIAKGNQKDMDAAMDAEMQMSKDDLAKLSKDRAELAHKAAEDTLSSLADEMILEAANQLAPILRVENTNYAPPKKSREGQRAASMKHMQRLRNERERMRATIGPRLIHMS